MSFERYVNTIFKIIKEIQNTQAEAIQQACDAITESPAADRWVHLFGASHANLPVEEGYLKCDNIVGFHPILELGLTYFTNILGSGGVPQIIFIERVAG